MATATCFVVIGSLAQGASAFTRTIADIEDPSVNARLLALEVEAARTVHAEVIFHGEHGSTWLSSVDFNHLLAGRTDGEQMPEVTVNHDPPSVTVTGKLATVVAQGQTEYLDFERCEGGRTTSRSAHLDVTLTGIYQPGASSSGLPEVSLATESLDPWIETCPMLEGIPPEVTRVQTFDSPTRTDLSYQGMSGVYNLNPVWSPVEGHLTTTEDGCGPGFCDFTISGRNVNTAAPELIGWAGSEFELRLRLEYPGGPAPEDPPPAGDEETVDDGETAKGPDVRSCRTAAQDVTKRRNISCRRAKKVANRSRRAKGIDMPECKGDRTVRWNGWRIRALDDRRIVVAFSKGNRRFLLSGGGAC